jgi:hypothetical protein
MLYHHTSLIVKRMIDSMKKKEWLRAGEQDIGLMVRPLARKKQTVGLAIQKLICLHDKVSYFS